MAKVLIVDDEPEIRRLLQELIEEAGHQPFEAADGVTALRRIKEMRPQLVILDWMIPEMRGDEVLEQLRNDSEYDDVKDTLVMVLSDFGEELSHQDIQRLGANHVMPKKYEIDSIRDQIHSTMLGLSDSHD